MSKPKIVFMGTSEFAVPSLEILIVHDYPILGIVTQPDRPKGRGLLPAPPPVKVIAEKYGLPVVQPERLKNKEFGDYFRGIYPDLAVVAAFGQILPLEILEIPKMGCINVHPSLLPKYRGAAPINWALIGGEVKTGVTIMLMDEGMDTGDILLQTEIPIGDEETSETLHDRLALLGAQLLLETVKGIKAGNVHSIPQNHSKATYAPPLKKEEGRIDWSKEAKEIDRQVRALNPWPGAFTEWSGQLLKIYRGEVRGKRSIGKAGVLAWVGLDFIEVETGKDFFLIKEVQLEGKRRMNMREFLAGHPIPVGTVFK